MQIQLLLCFSLWLAAEPRLVLWNVLFHLSDANGEGTGPESVV